MQKQVWWECSEEKSGSRHVDFKMALEHSSRGSKRSAGSLILYLMREV